MFDFLEMDAGLRWYDPEGGGAGTATQAEAETGAAETATQERTETTPEQSGGAELGGLKSALEKERAAVKAARAELRELREQVKGTKGAEEELESLRAKVQAFEFREAREATLEKVIAETVKDGKTQVDRDKAARLAAKLSSAESLEQDLAEIVETLAVPVPETKADGPKVSTFGGTPAKPAGSVPADVPYSEWPRLRAEDPDAYEEMMRRRGIRR